MQAEHATGERRLVTVFFVDVVGSTSLAEGMDPEDWATTMERAMSIMAGAVERYDGWVASHTGDGFLAFFGIPAAHEDDPVRAVSAGLDMIEAVEPLGAQLRARGLDFQIRVGINTGEVVVRETSAAGADRDSRMYGDAVNVAARMQAEARPGGIRITAATHARLPPGVEARSVGAVQVKGRADLVEAYDVIGRTSVLRPVRGVAGLASPMVGRDRELEELDRLLTAVRAGVGRLALVIGEPGIGKSRLLRECRARADEAGIGWIESRTVSYGRNMPLHLAIDLVRSLVGLPEPLESIEPADAAARLRLDLRASRIDETAEFEPILAHLLSLPLDAGGADLIGRMEPRTLQQRYGEAIDALLARAAAGKPTVVVCDDVHWADEASVELLKPMLATISGRPILWILSSRADRDVPGWRLIGAAHDTLGDALLHLRLQPLGTEHGRELVANLLEVESLPEATRQSILDRSEGNPLFMEEIIRMFIDREAIVFRDGRWEATDAIQAIEIPATLHGLLLARVDRLPAEARRLLRVAAVIGRTFAVRVLTRIVEPDATEPDTASVARDLGILEGAGLIALSSTEPELEYDFRHVLIQDAAYESLLKQERRALHAAVADGLLAMYPEHRDDLAPVLAHHFERAEDRPRAIEFLTLAAHGARARFARHETFDLAARSLALLGDDDPIEEAERRLRASLRLMQAEAGSDFTPLGETLPLLEAAMADAAALGDVELEARAQLEIAVARAVSGDQYRTSPDLARALDRAESLAQASGSRQLIGLALAMKAEARYGAAEFPEAIAIMEQAVPLLVDAGLPYYASMVAGHLGTAYGHVGSFEAAVSWTDRAYELGEVSGDPNATLDADLARSIVEGLRGDSLSAIEYAGRAAAEAERVDNKACAMIAHGVIGEERLRLGTPLEAAAAFETSAGLAVYCQFMPVKIEQTELLLQAARAQAGVGHVEFDRYERVIELARSIGDRLVEGQLLRQRAEDRIRAGQSAEARADLARASAIFEALGATPHLLRAQELDAGLAAE